MAYLNFGTLIPPKCPEIWGSNFENSFEMFSNETCLSYFQTLRMTSVFKKVADHSLNDTTYFISFEFWIMTSISGRLEWIEKRLFHLRQKNTTAIVTQYCTFHSVWKMGNFQTLCTISMHDYIFSKIVDEGKNFYSPTMDLKDTHMCLAFHSFVAK